MAVISVLAVGYSLLGKKILKMTPPSVQKFDLEDTGKLVAIVAASEMTREYLIKHDGLFWPILLLVDLAMSIKRKREQTET